VPRSVLLGRPWPKPGEPLFLPDDIDGALDLQLDEDSRCSRGHRLDEAAGEDGEAYVARHFTCDACAAIDLAEHHAQRDVRDAEGDAYDLVAGRHYYAVPASTQDSASTAM
jgi:hypothetical protein